MIPTRVPIARAARPFVPAAVLGLLAACAIAASPVSGSERSPFPRRESPDDVAAPVQITCPAPSAGPALLAPPALQIFWEAPRRDHPSLRGPIEYRYILLGPGSEFPVSQAVSDPESFRDYYANHPLGPWTGWETSDARSPRAVFYNLTPEVEYLFAVIALDREGNYSPTFGLAANMLHFVAGYPDDKTEWLPILTMTGPGFRHRYPQGGFCPCESTEIPMQMRAHQSATFRWSAEPGFLCESPRIRAYRWALDIEDVYDETDRIDEETDLSHWSQKSADATPVRLGPFGPGEVHRFYVWVEDVAGLVSLGIVRIEVAPAAANRRAIEFAVEPRRGGPVELSYSLPEPGDVEIGVFDLAGRRVATLEQASRGAGTHVVTWDPSGFSQGMYFYRLRAGSATVTKRVLLLR